VSCARSGRAALSATRSQREPCLVVIDEAHNICAAEPADPVSRIARHRTVQIAAEGRKYGLYLLVSTQRPNKVHENVVSQCDNLLMMRMNSHADLADLGRLFSFFPPGLLAEARRSGWARCSGGRRRHSTRVGGQAPRPDGREGPSLRQSGHGFTRTG
jgi:DNA helicase HerA-like ATPase